MLKTNKNIERMFHMSHILFTILNGIPLLCSGVFLGVALATSLVSVPKMKDPNLTKEQLVSLWRQDFKSTAPIQIGLVLLATLCSIALLIFYPTNKFLLSLGCGILLITLPWTLFVLMPINNQLLSDTVTDNASLTAVQALVNKWAFLHIPRIICAFVAFIFFYCALI